YQIGAIVLSPSYLDRLQGAVSWARHNGVPSIHLQHGSWPSPETEHPETADVVALPDFFALEVVNHRARSSAERVVTGLPFSTISDRKFLDPEKDFERQSSARSRLGIPHDAGVVLWTATLLEGLNLQGVLAHRFFKALQFVGKICRERTGSGKPTFLIIRQNPSYRPSEHGEAIRSLVQDEGSDVCRVISDDKEGVFDACDVVIPAIAISSVFLDALAHARPVVGFGAVEFPAHSYGASLLAPYCKFAMSERAFAQELSRLLDDRDYWNHSRTRGYEFACRMRPFSAEEGTKNVAELIRTIASRTFESKLDVRAEPGATGSLTLDGQALSLPKHLG
ncbi:MAG: glycosyltransferase, partial [Bdellovibrionales bacterium]|nr:glycosyltransferase [Bdellovibrionales bacterium]